MTNIAILGAGGMGKTHLDNIKTMDHAAVTAICDPNPAAKELADSVDAAFYTSLDQLLASPDIQVVLVCTPTFLHHDQITAILRAGKHCISEKPLCLSSAQAEELYALAEQQGLQLHVGQVLHFFDEYEILERLVREKTYGKVVDAFFYRLTAKPQWSMGNWLFDKEKSGLIPYDLHIHELDLVVSLFGKPEGHFIQTGKANGENSYNDYYRILYDCGPVTVCTESTWYESPIPFTQGFRVYFEKALLTLEHDTLTLYAQGEDPQVLHSAGAAASANRNSTSINVAPTNAYFKEVSHFLDCIRRGVPSSIVTKEQVLDVLKTLETF